MASDPPSSNLPSPPEEKNGDLPQVVAGSEPGSLEMPDASGDQNEYEEDDCGSYLGSQNAMTNDLGLSSFTLNGAPVQDVTDLMPFAPDGGYGWVIVFAAFMSNLIVDGICNAFTEFKSSYSEHFQASDATTALIGSLLIGSYLLVGPIVGGLVNKMGARKVVIIGSIIGFVGLALSIFAPNIYLFMLLYGLVGGIGFGFIYLPAIVVVGFWFEKKRAVATGIAVAGSGVGTIIMPMLSAYCIKAIGWKYAVIVLAICALSCIFFGILYKPLPTEMPEVKEVELQPLRSDEERAISKLSNVDSPKREHPSSEDASMIRLRNALSECEPDDETGENGTAKNHVNNSNKDGKEVPMRPRKATLTSMTSDMMSTSRGNLASQHNRMSARSFAQSLSRISQKSAFSDALSGVDPQEFSRPLNRQDVFYQGSIQNLKEYKEEGNMKNFRGSVLSIPKSAIHADVEEFYDDSKCKCIPAPVRDAFSQMIDLELLKDPVMLLLCISNLLGMMGFYIPFVFLKDLAKTHNISDEDSTYLVPIIGVTNTIGRVVFGAVCDRGYASAIAINNFSLVSCGIMTLICPLLTTFTLQVVYASLFGFIISAYISLTSIVLTDILGLDKLTNSFGLLVVARGIASLAGSPFAGLVYDLTQSYQAAFYFAGMVIVISGLISCAVPYVHRRQRSKGQNEGDYDRDADAASGKLSVLTERSEENLTEYQRTIQSLRQQYALLQEMEDEKKKIRANGVVEEVNEDDEKEELTKQ